MLPTDIQGLIATYITKPSYVFNITMDWLAKYLKISVKSINITKEQYDYLMENPLITRTYKMIGIFSGPLAPNELIEKLAGIKLPRAVKQIMKIDNWLNYIIDTFPDSGAGNDDEEKSFDLLDKLLKNPHAGVILDRIYEVLPNIFNNIDPSKLLVSKSAENIITNPNFARNYPFDLNVLLTNPSKIVFERLRLYELYISNDIFGSSNITHLLRNTNDKLLSLAIPHISNYLTLPTDFNKLSRVHRIILRSYIVSLAVNPCALASELLEKIFSNLKNLTIADIIKESGCDDGCDQELMLANPSDYITGSAIEYVKSRPVGADNTRTLLDMRYNTNPKAINFIKDKLESAMFDSIIHCLANNPGAIQLIKEDPDKYMSPQLLSNPAIFVPVTNKELVNKINKLIEL